MFVQFRAGIWLGWCVVGGGFTFTSNWPDQNLHFTLTENVAFTDVICLSFHGNINDVLYCPSSFCYCFGTCQHSSCVIPVEVRFQTLRQSGGQRIVPDEGELQVCLHSLLPKSKRTAWTKTLNGQCPNQKFTTKYITKKLKHCYPTYV